MSDDPTRATPLPDDVPSYGNVGPRSPHEDPVTLPALLPDKGALPGASEATDPKLRPVTPDAPTVPTSGPQTPAKPEPVVVRTRTGGLYAGLILSAIVLVFLLIFILQNLGPVTINFLGFSGSLPIGVALLLAAIAGLLLVAIPGGLRILQLRRAARRAAVR